METLLQPYEPKQRYIPKHKKPEQSLQLQAVQYLRLVRPYAIFRSDFSSGMKLSMYQATLQKRLQSSKSFPDLFIFEPKEVTLKDGSRKLYYGMGIELKKEGTRIILTTGPRKGQLTSNPHIREQYFMLKELAKRGYYTNFAVGIDEFIKIVNWYFGIPSNSSLF